ncbi:MAG: hypothetical protein HQL36_02665, partial [Alphaproteobacteria bacterium]|nr:hypothetical protein [Alphaproteobacteria bacterium]
MSGKKDKGDQWSDLFEVSPWARSEGARRAPSVAQTHIASSFAQHAKGPSLLEAENPWRAADEVSDAENATADVDVEVQAVEPAASLAELIEASEGDEVDETPQEETAEDAPMEEASQAEATEEPQDAAV